ncbi:MAG: T9SS type A sorting domain-containing protein [Bacteroidota bacterium]
MKKIYTLFLILFITANTFAQTNDEAKTTKQAHKSRYAPSHVTNTRGVIWSSNFTNQTDWTTSGSSSNWVFTSTFPQTLIDTYGVQGVEAFTSTSGGQYAMLNSDGYGSVDIDAYLAMAAPISTLGKSTVVLNFEQYYGHYDDIVTVEVSDNNSTWTEFILSNNSLANNDLTANPDAMNLDISSVAANKANVYIRFRYQGNYGFFWCIDDVSITDGLTPTFNAGVLSFITPVSGCSLSSQETVSVKVKNFGNQPISSFNLSYSLNGGSAVTQAYNGTAIAPGDTAIFSFTTKVNLSNFHPVDSLISWTTLTGETSTGNDSSAWYYVINTQPSSAPYSIGFESSELYYNWTYEYNSALSNGWETYTGTSNPHIGTGYIIHYASTTNAANNWAYTTCLDLEAAKQYKVKYFYKGKTGKTNKLKVAYGTSKSAIGMTTTLIDKTLTNDTYLADSAYITPSTTGTYYIGFNMYSEANNGNFYIDDFSITEETTTNINNYSENIINVYPNPASDIINISSDEKIDNINIYNTMGQLVISTKEAKTINISSLKNGIYTIQINSNNNITTKMIQKN